MHQASQSYLTGDLTYLMGPLSLMSMRSLYTLAQKAPMGTDAYVHMFVCTWLLWSSASS